MTWNKIFVLLLMLSTTALILSDQGAEQTMSFLFLKTALQMFLLGWSGFLVISHFYDSSSEQTKVIKIRRKSDHFSSFAFYGIIISIAQFALVFHYDNIYSFETILIAIFLLYFFSQLLQNSYPKVMVSSTHLGHSDFQSTLIPWNQVQKIRLEPQLLVIQTKESEKSIPLSGMEDLSVQDLEQELAAEVLDGSLASESTSMTLSQIFEQYANDQGFDLESTL